MKPLRGRRRRLLFLLVGSMAVVIGLGAFVGYNYYTYRTFWGNPNTYPAYVKSFGTVQTRTFYSKALGKNMTYEVYLPPGYGNAANRRVRYPVVYLLHGAPGSYDDWVKVGGAPVKTDTLLARNSIRPMIIVTPQGSPSRFATSTEYVNGPLGKWATYVTRDLVQRVDAGYRTVASKNGRAIAGLSEGGYAAVNLGLKNKDEFGVIGSFSGYFTQAANQQAFGGDKSLAQRNSPASYLPKLKGPLPAIYFYVGNSDPPYTKENQQFARQLKARGASYDFHLYPGGHSWSLWRGYLPEFLLFASKHLAGG